MTTTYLSPTIQNELILLLSDKVKNIIAEEVREAKYFAIMCDSTADISHTDQMALIVRYVTIHNGIAQVKKSFLNFFPLRGKTAAEIFRSILDELEVYNLDVMMCRGQGYDNASTINLRKVTIYLLTSCNTEERIAQNIYIHNSNRNYKKLTSLQQQY